MLFFLAAGTVYGLYDSPDPWPMFKHDLDRTGYAASTAPNDNTTLWSTSGVTSLSSPIVANGRVLAFASNRLYAFDETTGVKLWQSFTFTGTPQGIPAYVDGKIYVGTYSGYVYCIDENDGTKIWEYQITSNHVTTLTVAGGRVYVTTDDGMIFAMNATTSLPLPGWTYSTLGSAIRSWPVIRDNVMYFGCNDDKVRALNVSSELGPTLLWQFVTGGDVVSSPCYGDGKIFLGSSSADHSLFALNAATTSPTGEYIWKYTLDYMYTTIDDSPSYFDGTVYFGTTTQKVYALNANALPGNYSENNIAIKRWSTTVVGYPTSVAVADGKVFVGTSSQRLYALDTTTGFILWLYDWGSYSPETPIVADGRVFAPHHYGIYCFGTQYPALTYYYTLTPPGHSYQLELVIHNATPSMTMDINRLTTEKKLNYTIATSIPNTYTTCNITIPNEMLGGPYTVRIDGALVSHTLVNTMTHSSLYFAYFHADSNAHIVEITGTTVIPEFPAPAAILMTLMTAALAAAMLARKRIRN